MSASATEHHAPLRKRVLTVDADPEVIQILDVNLTHANLEVIPATSGAEALSKAATERPDIILLNTNLPDMDTAEICRQLKESPQTSYIPTIVIGVDGLNKKAKVKVLDLADYSLSKPFDIKETVSVVRAYLTKAERAENISRLTGLPNQTQVGNEISALLEQNRTFAAIFADMDDFRAFSKAYGFEHGDRAIRLVADVLREAVRLFGNPDDLVGHLGGDNFAIVTTMRKARILCRRIITDFDNRIRSLYKQDDLERGYTEYISRSGQNEQSPIMDLRLAVVSNEKQVFRHYLEVWEAAAEQTDYLRRFPGSNCYFDLRESEIESELYPEGQSVLPVRVEELKTLQRVLAWVAFLSREIDTPIIAISDGVNRLEATPVKEVAPGQLRGLSENANRLLDFLGEITSLARGEWATGSPVIGETNLAHIFEWILGQLSALTRGRRITIRTSGIENAGQLLLDGRVLTEGLFYMLQSLIMTSRTGDRLDVRVSENSDGNVLIELTNPNRFVPHLKWSRMYQAHLAGALPASQSGRFYLATELLRSLGGQVAIESSKKRGLTVVVKLSRRWKSSINDVNALLSAADISRNEARNQLDALSHILSSHDKHLQAAVSTPLKNVRDKIQELLVLCNRSLFLANDLNAQLELQQDRLLQQEVERFATSEALLTICRQAAGLLEVGHLFSRGSSQQVEEYVKIIAGEFKMSSRDRQAVLHAALLKDLGLVSSVEDMLEQRAVLSREHAIAVRRHFSPVWKAISQVHFLSRALVFVLHRYERYDGKGFLLGAKGPSIPLGAKILAVADTFDALVSGLSPLGKLSSEAAAKEIAAQSGHRFQPDVVCAFLRAWRRGELHSRDITHKHEPETTSSPWR